MTSRLLVAGLALLLGASGSAWAQDWHGHDRYEPEHRHGGEPWHGGEHWRDRDIYRFHEHDLDLWRSGRWVHEHHDGRLGWWWITGGVWYFYPQPVYPFPDPYLPPMASPGPAPGAVYYYCQAPAGYYPYVSVCPSGWRTVPAR